MVTYHFMLDLTDVLAGYFQPLGLYFCLVPTSMLAEAPD